MTLALLLLAAFAPGAYVRRAPKPTPAPAPPAHPSHLAIPCLGRDGSISLMHLATGSESARAVALFNLHAASMRQEGRA